MPKDYLTIDIFIRRNSELDSLNVEIPQFNGHSNPFVLPSLSATIEELPKKLAQHNDAKEIGKKLFDSIFNELSRDHFYRVRQEANDNDLGISLRLHLDDVPEIISLPWEYLYDPKNFSFLNLSVGTQVVRCLLQPNPRSAPKIIPPLRILVVIPTPIDYGGINSDAAWELLQEELADLEKNGAVYLERLSKPTFSGLYEKLSVLRQQPDFHILHFVGHGEFNSNKKIGELIFENEDDQRGKHISGEQIANILRDYRPLRVVFLNACNSAMELSSNSTASVAYALSKSGLECVIGMQSVIEESMAAKIAHAFYGSLAGNNIDYAIGIARLAAYSINPSGTEWAVPVLYTSLEGVLFEFERQWETRASNFVQKITKLEEHIEESIIEDNIIEGLKLIEEGEGLGGSRSINTNPIRIIISALLVRLKPKSAAFQEHIESLLRKAMGVKALESEILKIYMRNVIGNYVGDLKNARDLSDKYDIEKLSSICTREIIGANSIQRKIEKFERS